MQFHNLPVMLPGRPCVLYDSYDFDVPADWHPIVPLLSDGEGEKAPPGLVEWTRAVLERLRRPLTCFDWLPPQELPDWWNTHSTGARAFVSPRDNVVALLADSGVAICRLATVASTTLQAENCHDVSGWQSVVWYDMISTQCEWRHACWSSDGRLFAFTLPGAHTLTGCGTGHSVRTDVSDADPSNLHNFTSFDRIVVLDGAYGWRVAGVLVQRHFGFAEDSPLCAIAGLSFRSAQCSGGQCTELVTVWHDCTVRRVHVTVPSGGQLESDSDGEGAMVDGVGDDEEDGDGDAAAAAAAAPLVTHSPRGANSASAAIPHCLLCLDGQFTVVSVLAVQGDYAVVCGRHVGRFVITLWRLWDVYPWYTLLPQGVGEHVDDTQLLRGAAVPQGLGNAPSQFVSLKHLLNPGNLPTYFRYAL